jgi:hypothetical protein
MVENRKFVDIKLMVIVWKLKPCTNFMDVSGMGVPDVSILIQLTTRHKKL